MATAGLTKEQVSNANLISQKAEAAGLTPRQALELIGASYAESGLRESARNASSGAFGLFQLLSKGYVDSYYRYVNAGESPAAANIDAILPSYVYYYKQHPAAGSGEAAAAVENSGEPPSWYASATGNVARLLEGAAGSAADASSYDLTNAARDTGKVAAKVTSPFTSVLDALKFAFSYRFLEILGGGLLLLLGLYLLARTLGVAPGPTSVAKVAASKIGAA